MRYMGLQIIPGIGNIDIAILFLYILFFIVLFTICAKVHNSGIHTP